MKRSTLMGALMLMNFAVLTTSASAATAPVVQSQPAVTAQDAWIREVPPVSPAAALFVRLHNASAQAQAITAMQSPAAERVEWHDMTMTDGHMRMAQRHKIILPVGDTILAPGASHLMLFALRQPLRVGDSVPVSVTLANGETLALVATVRASQPLPNAAISPHRH